MSHSSRRKARIAAFQILYSNAKIKNNRQGEELLLQSSAIEPKEADFCRELTQTCYQNIALVDQTLQNHLKNWKQSRISESLNAVLRLACTELLFFKKTDDKVIFNEAIEICREFAGEDAIKILNGVLHSISKVVEPVIKDSSTELT